MLDPANPLLLRENKRKTALRDLPSDEQQDLENDMEVVHISMCMYCTHWVYAVVKNKGHLCIKDTFRCTNLYSGNTFLPPTTIIVCPIVSVS